MAFKINGVLCDSNSRSERRLFPYQATSTNFLFQCKFLIAFCGETAFCPAGNSSLSYCHPTEIVSTLVFLYIIVQAGFSIKIAIFEKGGQQNIAELSSKEPDYPILMVGRVTATVSRKLLSLGL